MSGWGQAPAVPARRRSSQGRLEALALAVGAGGPIARILSINTAPRTVVVAVIAVVGSIAVGRCDPDRRWWVRLGLALAAGAVAVPPGGAAIGPWLAGGLVLADWAVRGRPPLPGLRRPAISTLPGVIALAGAAAWLGRVPQATVAPLVAVAAALVLTWGGSYVGDHLGRLTRRVVGATARVVSIAVCSVLGVPVVAVPWLAHRLVHVDPLEPAPSPGSRWLPLDRVRSRPGAPWALSSRLRSRRGWARWRQAVSVPLLGVLVVAAVALPGAFANPVPRYAAFAHDAWWPSYWREMSWLVSNGIDADASPRMRDVRGRYFNVAHGDRATWQPPSCTCPTLTVWMYGGSTTFGLGQRDDETIASDLARLAWRDGLDLHVVNKGVVGDSHWIEAERFSWDAVTSARPDLVIFYDGVNEITESLWRNAQGRGDDEGPVDVIAESPDQFPSLPGPGPGGAHFRAPESTRFLDPAALARRAVARYETSRRISEDVSAATHIPAVWFWQPSRFSRPEIAGEPKSAPIDEPQQRAMYREAAGLAGRQVVDLADAFDRTASPIFYDNLHTNELGAQLVAEDVYRHLRGRLSVLEAAAAHRSPPPRGSGAAGQP